MKTSKFFAGIFLAVMCTFSVYSQNVSSTYILTSGGYQAGTAGDEGVYYGHMAGLYTTSTGTRNTFIGHQAGKENTSGTRNTFLGAGTGHFSTIGTNNTFIGAYAGEQRNGSYNVYLGAFAGESSSLIAGSSNMYLGYYSGYNNSGSGNIFLGYYAGYGSTGSNLLYIDNNSTSNPLIWGNFASDQLKLNGKVGIGMYSAAFPTSAASYNVSDYKLIVNGGVLAKEVRVATSWADYVFTNDYVLKTLNEVECYIKENGHLPNVPSAKIIEEDGIEIGQMAKIQQEKIEELTLYTIQQQKQIDKQQKEIDDLKAIVSKLISEN